MFKPGLIWIFCCTGFTTFALEILTQNCHGRLSHGSCWWKTELAIDSTDWRHQLGFFFQRKYIGATGRIWTNGEEISNWVTFLKVLLKHQQHFVRSWRVPSQPHSPFFHTQLQSSLIWTIMYVYSNLHVWSTMNVSPFCNKDSSANCFSCKLSMPWTNLWFVKKYDIVWMNSWCFS